MIRDFIFQLFDSHNTCIEQELSHITVTKARAIAKIFSLQYHHIIVNRGGAFETYEKGERTEWSYPNGL